MVPLRTGDTQKGFQVKCLKCTSTPLSGDLFLRLHVSTFKSHRELKTPLWQPWDVPEEPLPLGFAAELLAMGVSPILAAWSFLQLPPEMAPALTWLRPSLCMGPHPGEAP